MLVACLHLPTKRDVRIERCGPGVSCRTAGKSERISVPPSLVVRGCVRGLNRRAIFSAKPQRKNIRHQNLAFVKLLETGRRPPEGATTRAGGNMRRGRYMWGRRSGFGITTAALVAFGAAD